MTHDLTLIDRRPCGLCEHLVNATPPMCGRHRTEWGGARMCAAVRLAGEACGPAGHSFAPRTVQLPASATILEFPKAGRLA